MNTLTTGYNDSLSGYDMESLHVLLQEVASVKALSVANLQLTFYRTENGVAMWHLRNLIEEQLLD